MITNGKINYPTKADPISVNAGWRDLTFANTGAYSGQFTIGGNLKAGPLNIAIYGGQSLKSVPGHSTVEHGTYGLSLTANGGATIFPGTDWKVPDFLDKASLSLQYEHKQWTIMVPVFQVTDDQWRDFYNRLTGQ